MITFTGDNQVEINLNLNKVQLQPDPSSNLPLCRVELSYDFWGCGGHINTLTQLNAG